MRSTPRLLASTLTAAFTLLVLDLLFLGVVARGLYDDALGALRRPAVHWPAAASFYVMYVSAIVLHAVRGAWDGRTALQRGAGLGFVAYATYELTNWAVLEGWPAVLVPVDITWGVILTSITAWTAHRVYAGGPSG